jgi:cyclophilin family peptidyl-prolyl cis-trans isomerase
VPHGAAGVRGRGIALPASLRLSALLHFRSFAKTNIHIETVVRRKTVKELSFLALAACLASVGCGPASGGKGHSPGNPVVVMETSMGNIKLELFKDKAPRTVSNFLQYVDDKFYNGTVFHRVILGFMIQGGGYLPGLEEKPTREAIQNESFNGLSNETGTIAMARTNDPNSATAQFFINVANNNAPERINLDRTKANPGFCVFGRVLEGMDVADKIAAVETHTLTVAMQTPQGIHSTAFENVPVQDVLIKSIRRVEK